MQDRHRRPSNKGVSSMKETSTLMLDTCSDGVEWTSMLGKLHGGKRLIKVVDWRCGGIRSSGGEGQEV